MSLADKVQCIYCILNFLFLCSLSSSRLTYVLWTLIITSLNCQRNCLSFPTNSSLFRRSQRCSCPLACLQRETSTPATVRLSTGASDLLTWSLTSETATWPHLSTPTCWERMKLLPGSRLWSSGQVSAWRRWGTMSSHEWDVGAANEMNLIHIQGLCF